MRFNIVELDSVASTNDVAADPHYTHGAVIVAHEQTGGRGQRGNRWESAPGENLMFSLKIEPDALPADRQFLISMSAVLAASDALIGFGLDCRLKWPNDLYVGNRKIGGILIENTLRGPYITSSVIGIGVNVMQKIFDPSIPNPTSCILENAREPYGPGDILRKFCGAFPRRYDQPAEKLAADYMDRLWRGKGIYPFADESGRSNAADDGGRFNASIDGIDPFTGMMTLRLEDGSRRQYWFKEVEFLDKD